MLRVVKRPLCGKPRKGAGSWRVERSANGRRFYYNRITGESSWTRPSALGPPSVLSVLVSRLLLPPSALWQRHLSDDGRPFYVHTVTGERRWDAPANNRSWDRDPRHRPYAAGAMAVVANTLARTRWLANALSFRVSRLTAQFDNTLDMDSMTRSVTNEEAENLGGNADFATTTRVVTRRFHLPSNSTANSPGVRGTPPEPHAHAYATGVAAREHARYPKEFFTKSGVEHIVVAANLSYDSQERQGVPEVVTKTLYWNARMESIDYLKLCFHHELFHMTDYAMLGNAYLCKDVEWASLNEGGDFEYCRGGGEGMQGDTNAHIPGSAGSECKGFLNKYSMSSMAEDKAEVFAALMCSPQSLEADEILRRKAAFLQDRLIKFCPEIGPALMHKDTTSTHIPTTAAPTVSPSNSDWVQTQSGDKRYWYNKKTRETSWYGPLVNATSVVTTVETRVTASAATTMTTASALSTRTVGRKAQHNDLKAS
eukprot:jgi/Chlat1/6382/Chrsp44S09042